MSKREIYLTLIDKKLKNLSSDKLLSLCAQHNFPQSLFRYRQLFNCQKLIPEFLELLEKGWHSLDYLSLLSRLSKREQKNYLNKVVSPLRVGYNDQKIVFERMWDIKHRSNFSWKKTWKMAKDKKSVVDLKNELFMLRYPTFVKESKNKDG